MNKITFSITPLLIGALFFSLSACVDIVSSDCSTDEECVEQTDGEYATCGNSETRDGWCCKAGTLKCPCLEDDTCNDDLVCFDQDLGDDFPKGKFCNMGWVEGTGGLTPVE